jgi:internalin A
MAVVDEAEGLAEARRRIAACCETRSESLDLSELGLKRVPEELLELDWLRELNLNENGIGADGARALAGLVNLTTLDLAHNGVIDLSLFLHLKKLRKLDCSGCRVEQAPPELWEMPSLEEVILYETELPSVPQEVLSQSPYGSCLQRLRAHYMDLKGGKSEITDFKLMLLGNGRVGKTQICRRLQGQEYDEDIPSTHGVKIGAALLAVSQHPATLRIWDFGGQDIYHGTHALFLKSRAIFMPVWTPESEACHEHNYGGFTFRNQPLGYWLDYVREFGGEGRGANAMRCARAGAASPSRC